MKTLLALLGGITFLMTLLFGILVAIIVVDEHKADFWKQVFPKIKVHDDMAVRSGGQIATGLATLTVNQAGTSSYAGSIGGSGALHRLSPGPAGPGLIRGPGARPRVRPATGRWWAGEVRARGRTAA